jgi:hypothetical protein
LHENYLPNGNKLRSGVATNSIVPPCFLFTVYQHPVVLSAWSIYTLYETALSDLTNHRQPDINIHQPRHDAVRSSAAKPLITPMIRDFKLRFEYAFMPTSDVFNPIPAAACLLDPTDT